MCKTCNDFNPHVFSNCYSNSLTTHYSDSCVVFKPISIRLPIQIANPMENISEISLKELEDINLIDFLGIALWPYRKSF